MNVTIAVVAYTWKQLKNKEIPLYLRVTKDRKKKHISLGISVKMEHWDFIKNQPKKNCPNKEEVQQIIIQKTKEYQGQVLEYKLENKDFTAKNLIEKIKNPVHVKTVKEVFNLQIERLVAANRLRYAEMFQLVMNSLIRFNGHLDIYFSDIDVSWLKQYELWLRKNKLKENSIGIRFRTLRVIFNVAIEEKITKKEYYPFGTFKVSKLHQMTAKRAISKDDIAAIINYQVKSGQSYADLAIDLFVFSYLNAGINFVDIRCLVDSSISIAGISRAK